MLNADELDQLTKEYLEADARRQEYAKRCEGIKAKLRAELAVGRYDTASGVKVAIVPQRRFNEEQAREVVPPELLEHAKAVVIDAKKAKQAFPPALYEACMKEIGDPRVSIQ